jgi:hypothetical protein
MGLLQFFWIVAQPILKGRRKQCELQKMAYTMKLSATYMLKATIKQTLKPALFGKSMRREHYIPTKTYWEMARIRAIALMSQHRLSDAAPTANTIIPN